MISITFAKLEYDLEQLPPFAFRSGSTMHSFIRPCFARWSLVFFSKGSLSFAPNVSHLSFNCSRCNYSVWEYICDITGSMSNYLMCHYYLFCLGVIFFGWMFVQPQLHAIRDVHATRIEDL
jgi:hypothetical protein